MGLFKRRKKEEEVVDTRTKIEKTFEEKGQHIGRRTGEFVQKSVNKFEEVKQNLEEKGAMDKLRDVGNKIDDTIDKVVDEVTKQTKKVLDASKKKTTTKEDDMYYE